MNRIITLSIILFCLKLSAQPVFNLSNLVSPNQTLNFERGILDQSSIEVNGANLIWDFSEIEGGFFPQNGFSIRLAEVNDVPQVPPFENANRILVQEEEFGINYNHLLVDENGLRILTAVEEDFTIYPIQFQGVDLKFPVIVPESFNNPFSYQETFPSEFPGVDSTRYKSTGSMSLYVGAYGNLILPGQNNYEVICIQRIISSIDTIENFINGEWQFESSFSDFTEQLEFLSSTIGYYVARASLVEGEQSYYDVEYFTDIISSTENLNNTQNSFAIYPNPAQDYVNVKFNNSLSQNAKLTIVDASGRIVYKDLLPLQSQNCQINTSSFPSGLYQVIIMSDTFFESHTLSVIK